MGVAVEAPAADTEQPGRPRWRRAAVDALPSLASLLVCLVLAAVVFARNWASPASTSIGPGQGDGALLMWFLRWTPYALEHGLNPLFTTHLNVPDGVNVLWNTSLLLPGLLLAPITTAFGPVLTFNLLLVLGLAFSPYMLAQSHGHLHLTLVFLVPLLLLVLDEQADRRARRLAEHLEWGSRRKAGHGCSGDRSLGRPRRLRTGGCCVSASRAPGFGGGRRRRGPLTWGRAEGI
jgi:hypothetical protein